MSAREGEIAANLSRVRERIARACEACGRDPATVTLVGVAKTMPAGDVAAAVRAGLRDVGENYAQELAAKAPVLDAGGLRPRWHFLGHLQTNKVRLVMPWLHAVHSVDRPSLVEELARRADPARPVACLVEVNLGGEASKTGAAPAAAGDLCRGVLAAPGLRLAGLMCIPPPGDGGGASRPWFAALRRLRDDLRGTLGLVPGVLEDLSMGMSDDLEAAVAEGATMVRVGTAIFGPRR